MQIFRSGSMSLNQPSGGIVSVKPNGFVQPASQVKQVDTAAWLQSALSLTLIPDNNTRLC